MIDLARKINALWEPVFPYLAAHIEEIYGRGDGTVLDVGPFAGTAGELMRRGTGDRFVVASFPRGMAPVHRSEIAARIGAGKIEVIDTEPGLGCIRHGSIDLLIFRGALFFPSLFRTDLSVMYRVLSPNGVAFVGGGFGRHTPPAVIEAIGEESRDLNLRLGKVGITPREIRDTVKDKTVAEHMEIVTDGGLWVILRKPGEGRG